MKQYTTQTKTLHVTGQENLLAIADRLVVAAQTTGGHVITWEGDAITVEGDSVSWDMTTEQTARLLGTSNVELTAFVNGKVVKTETVRMRINPSVWDNGGTDER